MLLNRVHSHPVGPENPGNLHIILYLDPLIACMNIVFGISYILRVKPVDILPVDNYLMVFGNQAHRMQERGWKPQWFAKDQKTDNFRYIGGYWEAREQRNWESCPHIFGEITSDQT